MNKEKKELIWILGDRVAIKLFKVTPESTPLDHGLVLPPGTKSKEADYAKYSKNPNAGMVMSVGDGIVGDHKVDMCLSEGDVVILEKIAQVCTLDNGRMIVSPSGESYYIARRSEIMAVVSVIGENFSECETNYNNIKANDYE